jgi:hypothetical protein
MNPARASISSPVLEPGLVEEADQVDVGGIVQLPRAHLAHGQRHHARAVAMGVLLGLAGDLAAPRLPRDMVAERGGKAGIGEIGPGLGDGLQAPDPAQIGQRDQERGAAFQLPQARCRDPPRPGRPPPAGA